MATAILRIAEFVLSARLERFCSACILFFY
jgi:hypothetical protein